MTRAVAKKRRPRGSLSKDVILSAAQTLLHDEGIESLSIRKIANALNAGTMSIYSHYATKQEIIAELVAAFVKRAHAAQHDSSDHRQWLYLTFFDIYNATVNEPEYLLLMINSSNVGEASVDVFEQAVDCLVSAGVSSQEATLCFHRLLSFTLGAAMLRNNAAQAPSQDTVPDEPPSSHQVQAHRIVLGKGFDDSLRSMIALLTPDQ